MSQIPEFKKEKNKRKKIVIVEHWKCGTIKKGQAITV